MEARSDEELLAAHLAGRAEALDVLINRYAGELYAFLSRFVGNAASAEDLVQETFLQVHLSAGSFDSGRAFKPWLYTIAANKGRDLLRARGRRPQVSLDAGSEDGSGVGPTVAAEQLSQHEQLESDERGERVRAVIDAMPEHLRTVLMLGYYQQLPYADIAEILEIPLGTVKSRLHAAVQHFAREWRKVEAEVNEAEANVE